jgi:exocyst complex component 2
MATDIVKTYISVLSEFFGLSDMAVAKTEASEPKFLPLGTSSLITSYYLLKILQEINECINDLGATEISSEASAGLKELMDSVRWKFEDVLAFTWVQGNFFFCFIYSLAVEIKE